MKSIDTKQAPIPWKIAGMGDIVDDNMIVVLDNKSLLVGPEVLAFIVGAVNAHDDLLRAAKTALMVIEDVGGWERSRKQLESAITKAEGR